MATFLDIGLLQHFKIIFPVLFTFLVIYALLQYTNFLKGSKSIHALIAVVFAFLVLFSGLAVDIINRMAPWFVILFIFIVFGLLAFQSFGWSQEQILGALVRKDQRWIISIVGVIVLIIVLGSLLTEISRRGGVGIYGAENETAVVSGESGEQSEEFYKTIFHPKILGMAFVLLIMTFAVSKITIKPFD